ncbi:S8 family serine peptidase, partial [Thiohalocapsa marina]|uniref:S8 family serine peptidase n=1 Tax=Thiohalocapsa marina TaxID=424902 RepID=UPI0036DA9095
MNSLKAHLPRLHFQPLLAGCLAVASLLSAPATGYAQPALGSPYNGLTSDYPFSLAQVRDQRSPPAQRDRTHFAPSLAGIREQIALQGKTWVRADLRVPQVDLQRLDDQEKRIWMQDLEQMAQEVLASIPEGTYEKASRPPEFASITLSVDDIALDALRQSPLITVVEAMPPSPLVVDHSGQSRVKLTRDPIPDEYIVIYKEEAFSLAARSSGRLEADVSSLGRSLAARHRGSRHKDWTRALVGMSVRMSAADAAALAKDPRVALVEQNGYVYASEIQNSPVWGLDRVDQRELPLDAGYTYATGAHAVTAYVVDTGIRTTHAEFGGRATWGTNFAGDGNNTDCNGHGTHVAGTIGGATYGIAKDIRLVAVKVLGCDGSGTWTGVINGIDWMIANKQLPAVANLSLGGGYSASINRAVANAAAAGITMAVAAGNENTDACDSSPASEPSALTVGASTSSDARASFSNYGTCLDLFAPGQGITSSTATTDQSTGTWDGTSMATPHVAGAAALYLVANPDATPAEVASAINDNATTGLIADARTGSPNRLLFTALANDTLRLSVSKQGLGSVQSAPAGIDCGTACAAPFAPGTEVTLTATAGEGFTFSEWSGNCTGSDRTCMLTVDAVKSVQATFVDANGGTEVFPSGGVWPAGWTTPSGSSSPWSIAYEPVMEGSQSLRSGEISHNQTSAVEVAGYFQAGLVSFDWTVSSEANWDWLRFYIDGVRQDAISGCSDWTTACWKTFRQELDAGFHTLTWSYEKDYSVDSGMDSGWVDNVMLPAGGTIPANIPPVADPGGPYSGISGQTMTFDGTGSTDTDGTIVAYAWDFGDGQTGSGSTPSHTYASAGDYEVTLIVTDNDGAISDEARSSASVSDQTGAPVELFSDSFENGAWNGLWTEDRQNDWFTSTQRAVDGRYSAEIDGRASDAV